VAAPGAVGRGMASGSALGSMSPSDGTLTSQPTASRFWITAGMF